MSETQGQSRALAAFVLVTLIWGSTWLVIKDQISAVPPPWSVVWRFVLAATAMFVLARLRGARLRLAPCELRLALAVGLVR